MMHRMDCIRAGELAHPRKITLDTPQETAWALEGWHIANGTLVR